MSRILCDYIEGFKELKRLVTKHTPRDGSKVEGSCVGCAAQQRNCEQ